jgi:hypothetical protein
MTSLTGLSASPNIARSEGQTGQACAPALADCRHGSGKFSNWSFAANPTSRSRGGSAVLNGPSKPIATTWWKRCRSSPCGRACIHCRAGRYHQGPQFVIFLWRPQGIGRELHFVSAFSSCSIVLMQLAPAANFFQLCVQFCVFNGECVNDRSLIIRGSAVCRSLLLGRHRLCR